MKLKLVLTMAIVGTALASPSVSSAAPAPPPATQQDSVQLTDGLPANFPNGFSLIQLNATSGPSGENPTGQVGFAQAVGSFEVREGGQVTCLAVSGNSAVINYESGGQVFSGQIVTVEVVDDSPDALLAGTRPLGRAATDCSPVPPEQTFYRPVISGDITVTDAPPLPSSKDQCRNDGWKQFGFPNLGRCIAFVSYGS